MIISLPKVDYEPLKEWMYLERPKVTQNDLAEIAGVTAPTISNWITRGLPFSGEAILRIKLHFNWDAQQVARFFFNGPMPVYKPTEVVVQIGVKDLLEIVERRVY